MFFRQNQFFFTRNSQNFVLGYLHWRFRGNRAYGRRGRDGYWATLFGRRAQETKGRVSEKNHQEKSKFWSKFRSKSKILYEIGSNFNFSDNFLKFQIFLLPKNIDFEIRFQCDDDGDGNVELQALKDQVRSLKKKCLISLSGIFITMIVGGALYSIIEEVPIDVGFYWAAVTMTTVGWRKI